MGIEIDLLFLCVVKIDFLCRGSKLLWFQLREGNWLGFCVGVENDLGCVWIEIHLVLCRAIEIDLISVLGSK